MRPAHPDPGRTPRHPDAGALELDHPARPAPSTPRPRRHFGPRTGWRNQGCMRHPRSAGRGEGSGAAGKRKRFRSSHTPRHLPDPDASTAITRLRQSSPTLPRRTAHRPHSQHRLPRSLRRHTSHLRMAEMRVVDPGATSAGTRGFEARRCMDMEWRQRRDGGAIRERSASCGHGARAIGRTRGSDLMRSGSGPRSLGAVCTGETRDTACLRVT